MTAPLSYDLLRQRIAETIAWCRLRGSLADPQNSLRTPELRPSHLEQRASIPDYFRCDWGYYNDYQTGILAVSALADRRAELLREAIVAPESLPWDSTKGRFLIADPINSLDCALSEDSSAKFIDDADVPAWDTWVGFFYEERVVSEEDAASKSWWATPEMVCYLLCWIPSDFVALAEEGIAVNPVECLIWARDYKHKGFSTHTTRWLDSERLLW